MKQRKFLSLLCALILSCSLFSCQSADSTDKTKNTGTGTPESTEESFEPASPDDRGYLDLECRETSGKNNMNFCFGNDNVVITLPFPKQWTLMGDAEHGYQVLRDGVQIGSLVSGTLDLPRGGAILNTETTNGGAISIERSLIADPSADSAEEKYIRRFVYTYETNATERVLTLELGYVEMDDFRAGKLFEISGLSRKTEEVIPGSIKLTAKAGEKPILILGNSFIGSSQIGTFLQDMCNGSTENRYDIRAVSVGYASVSETWESYLEPMKNGDYAAVFMCGFYSSSDVSAFTDYVQACASSDTPLAILPAHNETQGTLAAGRYPEIHYINWKGDIDRLIADGVAWADFCVDDMHKHSKPLAGYVGAHMIYRALFGEAPPVQSYYASLSYTEIKAKLGDYVNTGYLASENEKEIFYLK